MDVVLIVVAALLAIVLVVLVMRVFARRLYDRHLAFEQRMIAGGVETTATVTKVPSGPNGWTKAAGVWGVVTFAYADSTGAEHTVKRRVYMHRQGDVRVGETSRVWYDPQAPDDVTHTVVELEQRSRPAR